METKALYAALTNCSKSLSTVAATVCTIVKSAAKFDKPSFSELAQALTDVSYLFEDVNTFVSSFQNCLNDQSLNVSAIASVRSVENLNYQLNTYLVFGKFNDLADKSTPIFGTTISATIKAFALLFTGRTTEMGRLFGLVRDQFNVVATSGAVVATNDINVSHITNLTANINVFSSLTSQVQLLFILLSNVTTIVDKAATSVAASQSGSVTQITRASFTADQQTQLSKKTFKSNVGVLATNLAIIFDDFFVNSSKVYADDTEFQLYRSQVDGFLSYLTSQFEITSVGFTQVTNLFSSNLTATINQMVVNQATYTRRIVNDLTDFQNTNSQGQGGVASTARISECLGPQRSIVSDALKLISQSGNESAMCVMNQQNTTLTSGSLLNFIVEDVVQNAKGIADKLCSCVVDGGKTVKDLGKACIKKVNGHKTSTRVQSEN